MHCACTKRPSFQFRSKIWRHRRVPRPGFPIRRGNFGDSRTFKAYIELLLISAWIFSTSWSKMFWGGKMGKGWCDVDPNELVCTFGVLTSVAILVKIDQEMRPWECAQTDTQIHWQTDANQFYYLSCAIC